MHHQLIGQSNVRYLNLQLIKAPITTQFVAANLARNTISLRIYTLA